MLTRLVPQPQPNKKGSAHHMCVCVCVPSRFPENRSCTCRGQWSIQCSRRRKPADVLGSEGEREQHRAIAPKKKRTSDGLTSSYLAKTKTKAKDKDTQKDNGESIEAVSHPVVGHPTRPGEAWQQQEVRRSIPHVTRYGGGRFFYVSPISVTPSEDDTRCSQMLLLNLYPIS